MSSGPPGFEEARATTEDDLKSLPSVSHAAAHTLERCIAERHVAEIDYVDEKGERSKILLRPAYIRYNRSGHVVAWGMATDAGHWEELRLDRIHAVRDTGEVFEPSW
jgi:predicted DNA-binding transcriptional regulator YafY